MILCQFLHLDTFAYETLKKIPAQYGMRMQPKTNVRYNSQNETNKSRTRKQMLENSYLLFVRYCLSLFVIDSYIYPF